MKNESKDIIKISINNMRNSIYRSKLPDNEKNALRALLEKLGVYYDKKIELMAKKGIDINSNNERVMILKGFVTDVLVDINTVLDGNSDVHYFISLINNELNDKGIEKLVKSKKI